MTAPTAPRDPRRMGLLSPGRRVPAPVAGEPTDDELLQFLDGALDEDARREVQARLERSPGAQARLDILAAALAENGWAIDGNGDGDGDGDDGEPEPGG